MAYIPIIRNVLYMSSQKLRLYMSEGGITQSSLSKEIGRPKQAIWNWLQGDATIELTDIGIRIRTKSGRIVHETQVAK